MNRNKIKRLIAITVTTSTLFQLNCIKATTAFAKDNSSSTNSYSLEEEKEQYEAFQKLYNEIKTRLQEKVITMGDNFTANEDTRSHDIFRYLVEDIDVVREDNFYFTKEGGIEIGVSSSNDRKGKIVGKVLIRAPYSKDEFLPFEIEYKYTPVETELSPPYEGTVEDDLATSNDEQSDYEAFQKLYSEIKTMLQEKINTIGDNFTANEDTRSHDIFTYLVEDIEVVRDDNFYFTKEGNIQIGVSSSNDRKGKIIGRVLISAPYSKDEFLSFEIEYKYVPNVTEVLPPYEGTVQDDLLNSNDDNKDESSENSDSSKPDNTQETEDDNNTSNSGNGEENRDDEVDNNTPNYGQTDSESSDPSEDGQEMEEDKDTSNNGTGEDYTDDKIDSSTNDDDTSKDEDTGSTDPSEDIQETEDGKDDVNNEDDKDNIDGETDNSQNSNIDNDQDSDGSSSSGGSGGSAGDSSSSGSSSESNSKPSLIVNADGSLQIKDSNGQAATGWQHIDNKWYLCDSDGNTLTGWQKVNGQWYYLNNDSTMHTGWLKDSKGKWYHLKSNGSMSTGWLKDTDGKWYHLKSNGSMSTGWLKDTDGKWYHLKSNGSMSTGWLKDTNGKWYHLKSNGSMSTGWLKDTNGKWYYLNTDGSMASNTKVNGYYLGKDGALI